MIGLDSTQWKKDLTAQRVTLRERLNSPRVHPYFDILFECRDVLPRRTICSLNSEKEASFKRGGFWIRGTPGVRDAPL